MADVPILQGTYADSTAAFRTSLPINLEPSLADSGISKGYLVNTPGVALLGTGPGADRGAINWNGVCYRVMGSNLVSVAADDTVTILGDVGNDGLPVTLDYSFPRLIIASNNHLYYWTAGEGVTEVTDPDLGIVKDAMFIDGYTMTTDGQALVVTDLNDPYSVNPIRYGSAEEDPDPIVGLRKVRGEAYAVGLYTIQNFQDSGGTGFPFQNNPGGLIPKGCVGTHAMAYFLETYAFVGSGKGEAASVYLAGAGTADPISTPEVDTRIAQCTPDELALIEVEARIEQGEQRLYVHLPTETLVYMRQASIQAQQPIWYVLNDGAGCDLPYSPRHMALAYGKWIVGSATGQIGELDYGIETRFGAVVGWQFDTAFLFNGGRGMILKAVELIGLPGRAPFGVYPTCSLSTTQDGQTWGQERFISMGLAGERRKRVQWRPKTRAGNYTGLRFRGANTSIASWAKCIVDIEGLGV